jgi:hypothetical protein
LQSPRLHHRQQLEYSLAVAEMAACIQDTHTYVAGSKELNRFFGEAAPPVALRLIEGKPAIIDLRDAKAVLAYRFTGSFARHFKAIVSRSRGSVLLRVRNGTGSFSKTSIIVSSEVSA